MKEIIMNLIDATMGEYLRYSKSLNTPSLSRFMVTIIDQERQHKEEVEELDRDIFACLVPDHMESEIQALSRPLKMEGDIAGLQEVAEREDSMADLFEGLAARMESEEGKIFFSQYAHDERKHAGLVRSRLELESLA
ncbi:ferritin family protein [Marispirochaeta sp.]|jgi:rubrerythrin|uniref:ferritin family protein n=1 Tax=Marispirochaeta sp. TaxID=2038653 RepID=UPI0029C81E23|nr:ferritin family protein [Marispirochaeta sp.]